MDCLPGHQRDGWPMVACVFSDCDKRTRCRERRQKNKNFSHNQKKRFHNNAWGSLAKLSVSIALTVSPLYIHAAHRNENYTRIRCQTWVVQVDELVHVRKNLIRAGGTVW